MKDKYDVAIIGSGPGGYVAAIRAAVLGLSVCLIEKSSLGGVCLNCGCIPTKTLLKSAHTFDILKKAADLGINAEKIEFNYSVFQTRKNTLISQLRKGIEFILKKRDVDIIFGQAKIIDQNSLLVKDKKISFAHCIIATGSEPIELPNVRFNRNDGILDSQDILELEAIPKNLLIIGGGVIGCEFADLFATLGSKVTVVELAPNILINEDPEIVRFLINDLKKKSVKLNTQTQVHSIEKVKNGLSTVIFSSGDKQQFEKILIAVGRKSNTDGWGIENIGIKLEKGKIIVNERMQTNTPNFYAVGDVVGKSFLAHLASREGIVAAENIANLTSTVNYQAVPRCVYTQLQVASVGMTMPEAQAQKIPIKIGKFPFTASSKAVIEKQTQGMVKIIAHADNNKILGVSICGPEATELIHEAVVALNASMEMGQFVQIVHAHPTLSESILEAAESLAKKPIHIL
ncbi:MAG: dihydrolipoyl dehydrogenase [Candidatus Omnitrophota bacterium]